MAVWQAVRAYMVRYPDNGCGMVRDLRVQYMRKGRHRMSTKTNAWLGGEAQNEGSRQRPTRWLTPTPVVEALGRFDLDPCGAPGHDLADRTYLIDRGEDGLELPWTGRVWLNPPYGKEAYPFLEKMADHGNGVALIFARTETAAFYRYVWDAADAVLFLRGRISFWDADKVPAKANAGAPSCLVAYGQDNVEALRVSGLGQVVTW